jgi:hypothetical protein
MNCENRKEGRFIRKEMQEYFSDLRNMNLQIKRELEGPSTMDADIPTLAHNVMCNNNKT